MNGWFNRFARKERIEEPDLRDAAAEALGWSDDDLDRLVGSRTLVELENDDDEK